MMNASTTTPPVAESVRRYLREEGWYSVPIAPGTKKPPSHLTGWQDLRIEEEDIPTYFHNGQGVGLLLGTPSDGVVDIDHDCPESVAAADILLPPTGKVFGRPGNPSSHRLYIVTDTPPKTTKFHDLKGGTLVELRSTGAQTVVPPTVHESGEPITWEWEDAPTRIEGEILLHHVQHVAAAALLAKHWPTKGRHHASLALSGALLRAGWGQEKTETFVKAVCRAAGDEEETDRIAAVGDTVEKIRAGQETTGIPSLAELVGDDVVKKLGKWIALKDHTPRKQKQTHPRVRVMADVEPEVVRWVWGARIPRGKLSEIVGDPGEGKSWLTMMLVGLLTTGRPLPGDPDFDRGRETVLLLSAEDGAGDTLRPRLDDAGADVSRVHLLDGIEDEDGVLHLTNLKDPQHRAHLAHLVESLGITVVIIDPLSAYLGNTDSYRDSEVRGVLAPLAELAERTGSAIVAIRHLTKGSATRAIYRAGGSIGFTGSARSSLLVGRVDEDSEERAIIVIKSNLAAFPDPVGFSLDGGVFRWTGTPKVTASDLLRPEADSDDRGDREDAVVWLRETLKDGPLPSAQLFDRAKQELGISQSTVKRARRSMGQEITVEREGNPGGDRGDGRWVWRLDSRGSHTPDLPDPLNPDPLKEPYSHNAFDDSEALRGSTHEREPLDLLNPDTHPDLDPDGFERWAIAHEDDPTPHEGE